MILKDFEFSNVIVHQSVKETTTSLGSCLLGLKNEFYRIFKNEFRAVKEGENVQTFSLGS